MIGELALGSLKNRDGAFADRALGEETDIKALADFYAAQLHGISVQSRDGVSKERLPASIEPAMVPLKMATREIVRHTKQVPIS
ncbi:TetR family transcriptional regulator [Pandoraea horticolens]|uniref:TetR family transcriptional regulator n=1 Tax=Pandoraea horticolens TaxID=2508298 RepID=A0A5E4SH20_9BURK|nr:hypothetical protein [Pandoraea horticolens]VVD73309.1 TetR family transcriptional regulator [Pandoraea horticolens]